MFIDIHVFYMLRYYTCVLYVMILYMYYIYIHLYMFFLGMNPNVPYAPFNLVPLSISSGVTDGSEVSVNQESTVPGDEQAAVKEEDEPAM
ncbi:hypothetical protein SARC_13788, partial [Sphaeroforma arctica JP610]